MTQKIILSISLAKGAAISAIIVGLAETTFFQSLAIAVSSAIVSGSFLLISTRLTVKKTEEKVENVQQKVEKLP